MPVRRDEVLRQSDEGSDLFSIIALIQLSNQFQSKSNYSISWNFVTSNLISVPVRGDLVSVLGQASSQFVGSSFTYGLTPSASECEFSLLGGFSCSRSLSSCWSRLAKNVTRWKAAYSLILFPPIQSPYK